MNHKTAIAYALSVACFVLIWLYSSGRIGGKEWGVVMFVTGVVALYFARWL